MTDWSCPEEADDAEDTFEHGAEWNFIRRESDGALTEELRIVALEELLPPLPLDVLERNKRLWWQDDDTFTGFTAMQPDDFYTYFPDRDVALN